MKNIKPKAFLIFLSFFYLTSLASNGDIIYHSAKNFTLIGKAHHSKTNYYHRVDTAEYSTLPQGTKNLLSNSSGLMIAFKTNSSTISCKWKLSNYKIKTNMTAISHSGLDLYTKEGDKWFFAASGRPNGENSQYTLIKNMNSEEKEFLLYLPLYNTVEELEIGIESSTTIKPIPNPFEKKVVIYGSSITQGTSSSRPGLLFTSKIGRDINVEMFNLGLSGRGLMEMEAARMVADIEADMYILDCSANPTPKQITERTNIFVKYIRDRHPEKPIIMLQGREVARYDLKFKEFTDGQNTNFKIEYEKLIKEGMTNLFYIDGKDLMGHDDESTIDGDHPNDIGFFRMIEIVQPFIVDIFNKQKSN